jgi:predicted metal-binding protein
MSLKDWRERHAKKNHRTFFDAKIHVWHVHRCGGCGSRLLVPEGERDNGELAVGEEREK